MSADRDGYGLYSLRRAVLRALGSATSNDILFASAEVATNADGAGGHVALAEDLIGEAFFRRLCGAWIHSNGRARTSAPGSPPLPPLQVVTLLRDVPPVEPDPAFVSELRDQLFAAAVSRSTQLDRGRGGGRRAEVEEGTHTTATTRSRHRGVHTRHRRGRHRHCRGQPAALPGDLFYPVKRSIENVEFQLARGDSGKGSELLDQASTRLDEVEALTAEHPNPDSEQNAELNQAFSDFSSQTTDGGRRLIGAYATDDDSNAIGRIRVFTTQAATQLTDLAPAMPADLRTSFTQAATTVGALDALAVRICATCGGELPLVSVPGQPLSAGPFLTEVSNVELSDLPSTGAGGSHTVTLPGGPPVTGAPTTVPTTSGTPSSGTTPSGDSTGGTTSEPTSPTSVESSQTLDATVSLPGAVLTPITTTLPEDLETIVIPIPLPTLGLN